MTVIQVGLVDVTQQIDDDLVHAAAVALNLQATRDLPQFWPVTATVMYLPNANKVPPGVWPVQLVKKLPAGEGGFHSDQHKQPYAQVIAKKGDPTWTIDASHEILEMLVDPYGNRMQSSVEIEITSSGKIQDGTGQFGYLVEACDPCEDNSYAYTINGIAVSDFITPHFYDAVATPGTRYSFTGAVKAPRQILPGGYISWVTGDDQWQQLLWVDESKKPYIKDLPPADSSKSLREWIDSLPSAKEMTEASRKVTTAKEKKLMQYSKARVNALDKYSMARAKLYA
jgi:hypothetical protein